jgi:MFS family permease
VRELLARRDFRRMLLGQTVSALGDWLGTIAVMMMVLRLSGSATAVGGVLVLQLLPAAVAAPLVSRLVGGVDRRQVLLASDAIRAVLAVLLRWSRRSAGSACGRSCCSWPASRSCRPATPPPRSWSASAPARTPTRRSHGCRRRTG